MKITRSTIKVMMIVVGVLVLVLVLVYAKPSLDSQHSTLQLTNQQLTTKLKQIEDLEANIASYRAQTEEFSVNNEEVLSKFPADVRVEDAIMYATVLNEDVEAEITTVSVSDGNLLYSMQNYGDVTTDATGSSTDATAQASTGAATTATTQDSGDLGILTAAQVEKPNYNLYDLGVSYNFSLSYDDLKKMVREVLTDEDKRNIGTISLSYDSETGLLSGNMDVNMYFVTGTEKQYKSPDTGKIEKGKKNIFGTLSSSKKSAE